MTEIQEFLAGLVRSAGMTQRELAQTVGITESYLSRMLNGRVEGTLSTWQRLLDATGDHVEEAAAKHARSVDADYLPYYPCGCTHADVTAAGHACGLPY